MRHILFASSVISAALLATAAFAYPTFNEVTLLGISLGKPLNSTTCPMLVKACAPSMDGQLHEFPVHLPDTQRPKFMVNDYVTVGTVNNEVIELIIETRPGDDAEVVAQIKDKFGDPDDAGANGARWVVSNGRTALALILFDRGTRNGVIYAQSPKLADHYAEKARYAAPHL